MIMREENRDLSSVDENEYYLVQFVSAEFIMAVSIMESNNKKYSGCFLCDDRVFDLIIKSNRYQDTTYESLEKAFKSMKKLMLSTKTIKTNKIAIPKDDLGLDWNNIKSIIEKVFQDTNIEILICYK